MYITPTVPVGGVFLPIHAAAHLAALVSMHIGSGPGVTGLSPMQVQPFLPSRMTFIAPLASMVAIAASWAIAAGAADSALATGSLDAVALDSASAALPPAAASLPASPLVQAAAPNRAAPAASAAQVLVNVILPLLP